MRSDFRSANNVKVSRGRTPTYLLVNLGVIQHRNELLEKVLARDLFVKWSVASVDKDVEDAQREEDYSHLRHL